MTNNKHKKQEHLVAFFLVLCLLLVGFWVAVSAWSEREYGAFQLDAEDFRDFRFRADGWRIEKKEINPTPTEPEILKYDLTKSNRAVHGSRFTVPGLRIRARLTHGYNMVDCMRIKGYKVDLLYDTNQSDSSAFIGGSSIPGRVQVWKLANSVGDESIWATSMIRAGDFAVTDISTTDMPFPRIGVPDNPDWMPRGITWKSFRHPIKNLKLYMRAKWNNSRCDPLVFLKLKQPPWADEEVLTLVSNSSVSSKQSAVSSGGADEEVIRGVLEAHNLLYTELIKWKNKCNHGGTEDLGGEI